MGAVELARRAVAPLLVALALSITLDMHVRRIAPLHKHSQATFYSLEDGLEHYREMPRPWRSRLFANACASLFVSHGEGFEPGQSPTAEELRARDVDAFARGAGAWAGAWFFATCLVYWLALGPAALFFALGTFAGVIYGSLPGIDARVYPWDLPALFWYALFTMAVLRGRYRALLLIPLAVGFKETALVYALAFLTWEEASWRRRLGWFAAAGALSVAVKLGIDVVTGNSRYFFTMASGGGEYLRQNLRNLVTFDARHLLLVNAGLLAAFLLSPPRGPRARTLRAIALAFLAGILVWGNTQEVRIFYELLPVSLAGLAGAFLPALVQEGTEAREDRAPAAIPRG
jgi:hypothetical protein